MTTCASLAVFSDYRYVCFLLAELVEDGGGVSVSCENPDRPNHMGRKPFSQHFLKKKPYFSFSVLPRSLTIGLGLALNMHRYRKPVSSCTKLRQKSATETEKWRKSAWDYKSREWEVGKAAPLTMTSHRGQASSPLLSHHQQQDVCTGPVKNRTE